jgi:putative SOS response-associated peptidase YedK
MAGLAGKFKMRRNFAPWNRCGGFASPSYIIAQCATSTQCERAAALARKFGLSDNRVAAFEPLPAIFPGHMAPIIKQSADGERELVMRSWGFILLRDGYAPKQVTNTRDDKIITKFWKESFERRRCLVPASSFCEPDGNKPS